MVNKDLILKSIENLEDQVQRCIDSAHDAEMGSLNAREELKHLKELLKGGENS